MNSLFERLMLDDLFILSAYFGGIGILISGVTWFFERKNGE